MKISPIRFQFNHTNSSKDFNPTPLRYNALHDLEFDIIADKIRSENLKNQMTLRVAQIKKNINNFINPNNI